MFVTLTLFVATAYLLVTVAVPFRFSLWPERFLERTRRAVLDQAQEVLFAGVGDELHLGWVRVWGGTSAALFALFGILDGTVLQDEFEALRAVGFYAGLSAAISAAIVATCVVYASFLSRLRGYAALRQCGFQALWTSTPTMSGSTPTKSAPQRSDSLLATIRKAVRDSAHVGVLDVTGYETFGKGPGRQGGLLYDAVAAHREVPVSVLLLQPGAETRDPERRRATVFQTVLAEAGISGSAYQKRVESAIRAITELNKSRSPTAQIEVQFYAEKPTFQAVFFDESALVAASSSGEQGNFYAHVLPGEHDAAPSFYEIFRRQFYRIWGSSSSRRALPMKSVVIRKTKKRVGHSTNSTFLRKEERVQPVVVRPT